MMCKDCKALWYCYFVECGCLLHYRNAKIKGTYTPLEPCPKPMTDKEYKNLAEQSDNR